MTTSPIQEKRDLCLCCGQRHPGYRKALPMTQPEIEKNVRILEQLGYTREVLLDKHVDQLDWQLPGVSTWLRGQ